MMHTTLNKIRACDPCAEGWRKLLTHLVPLKQSNSGACAKRGIRDE